MRSRYDTQGGGGGGGQNVPKNLPRIFLWLLRVFLGFFEISQLVLEVFFIIAVVILILTETYTARFIVNILNYWSSILNDLSNKLVYKQNR